MKRGWFLPYLLLLALTLSAAAVLAAGVWFSRNEVVDHFDADRASLDELTGILAIELEDLEERFIRHMRGLCVATAQLSTDEVQPACDQFHGIRQWSRISFGLNRLPDHVQIEARTKAALLRPTFDSNEKNAVLLDRARLTSEPVGWNGFVRASSEFYFIERNSDRTFIVLTLDPAILTAQINEYLRVQLKDELTLIDAYEGVAALIAPGEEAMSPIKSIPNSSPFISVPVVSQFGVWRLDAWRRMETRIEYNVPLLAGACALAAILFLLGILAFVQQRSAIRLAEQRVSFVNRVSHELRTPLTNILLNGDLAAGAVEDRPTRAVQHLDLLREEARRLSRLIQNVLTFARSSRGKLKLSFEAVDLDETIREVVAQFEPSLKRAEIQVELGEIPANARVAADADAVRQILGNLIANVEKYAADAGFLGINVRESSDAQQLQILIADRGPGIPPSKSARIFEPFERLSSRVNEGVSGAGLGLAIGRELAERMNGGLDLETGDGGVGAVFVLTLPKSES